MYYDDYKYVNIQKLQQEFTKWKDLKLMNNRDLSSWNPLFTEMAKTLNTACNTCCRLKQALSMENTRQYQKNAPPQVRQKKNNFLSSDCVK